MKARIGGREVDLNIEQRIQGTRRQPATGQTAAPGESAGQAGDTGRRPASPSFIVIPGNPIGKPRQTRSDRWKQRPCVVRYRSWADQARLAAFGHPSKKLTLTGPTTLRVVAYLEAPKKRHRVGPHTVKPDIDNIEKAVMDALFENDQMVYRSSVEKVWADGGLPRVIVEWSEKIGFPVNQ